MRISLNRENYQYTIALLCIAILILFGTYHFVFSIIALLLSSLLIVLNDEKYSICLLIFIMPLASIFKSSPSGTSFFTYLELLAVLCVLLRRKFIIRRIEVIVISFGLYLAFIQLLMMGNIDFASTIKIACNLLLVAFAAGVDWDSDETKPMINYLLGIIVSSLFGMLDSTMFRIQDFIEVKTGLLGMSSITRFAGLYEDPNYYSVNLIISLCIIQILFEKKKISAGASIILVLTIVGFAGMTGSKSAFLMLIIPFMFFLFTCIKKRKYPTLIASIIVGVVTLLMILSNRIPIFNDAISRLLVASGSKNDLTTGRWDIWIEFINYFKEYPERLIFGESISRLTLRGSAPHNTYIDILFQLGIVGGLFLLYIIMNSFRLNKKNIQRSISNYCIIVTVIVMYFFLSELQYYDASFHIILGMLVLNTPIVSIVDNPNIEL